MYKIMSPHRLMLISALSLSLFLSACSQDKVAVTADAQPLKFKQQLDLLLVQFDSKTDVDDIHSIAAVATMLQHPSLSKVKYHAVAGAYGIQDGEYVPAPELFDMAFADHWSDAHVDKDKALAEVLVIVKTTLQQGGDIWIVEAGQSDFSAALIQLVKVDAPGINTQQRFHIVQHSEWNQDNTSPEALAYVKAHSDYYKIPDGNAINNGTAGYKSETAKDWVRALANKNVGNLWQTAKQVADLYNGQDGRYNNESIAKGGFDFSDAAELSWIFGVDDAPDVDTFFDKFLL